MAKEHHIIYIPGLSDGGISNKFVSFVWRKSFDVVPHVHPVHWKDGEDFTPKLARVVTQIDELLAEGNIVSLVGQSAGGSAVLNAFSERRNVVNGVVNVCGRVRTGHNVRPSLERAARYSPAFRQSVILFERTNEPSLLDDDRKKIMTIRALYDETVPTSTTPIEGATNITMRTVEHIASCTIATLYARKALNFLQDLAK